MEQNFKTLVLIFLILGITVFYAGGGRDYLSLENFQGLLEQIQGPFARDPLKISFIIFGGIVLLTSLSIPGSLILTLLTGALMGPFIGTLLVCLASTTGAMGAFTMSRFVLRSTIERKYWNQFRAIDRKLLEEGSRHFFTLRIVPVAPFLIINLVMGLTSIRALSFAWITFLAKSPGTFIYVYAGGKFAELESLRGIMSPAIIFCFLGLATFPYIWKILLQAWKCQNFLEGGQHGK